MSSCTPPTRAARGRSRSPPGEAPVVSAVHDSAIDVDVTLAGTADAIYRALWGRPSHAIVSGDQSLLDALPAAVNTPAACHRLSVAM